MDVNKTSWSKPVLKGRTALGYKGLDEQHSNDSGNASAAVIRLKLIPIVDSLPPPDDTEGGALAAASAERAPPRPR